MVVARAGAFESILHRTSHQSNTAWSWSNYMSKSSRNNILLVACCLTVNWMKATHWGTNEGLTNEGHLESKSYTVNNHQKISVLLMEDTFRNNMY